MTPFPLWDNWDQECLTCPISWSQWSGIGFWTFICPSLYYTKFLPTNPPVLKPLPKPNCIKKGMAKLFFKSHISWTTIRITEKPRNYQQSLLWPRKHLSMQQGLQPHCTTWELSFEMDLHLNPVNIMWCSDLTLTWNSYTNAIINVSYNRSIYSRQNRNPA